MKTTTFTKLIATTLVFLGFSQAYAAPGVHKIAIDNFPYVGSLVDSAANVDSELVAEAIAVCGSVENIAGLDNVTLRMDKTSVPSGAVNPNGIPGGKGGAAVFVFSYPRVIGSADLYCKN